MNSTALKFYNTEHFYTAEQIGFLKQFKISVKHIIKKQRQDNFQYSCSFEFAIKNDASNSDLKLIDLIKWPQNSVSSRRQNDLWKATCFEAFLSTDQNEGSNYYEFNSQQNGTWNFYQLPYYRGPLTEYAQVTEPQLELIEISKNEVLFKIQLNFSCQEDLRYLGLTLILETQNDLKSYWAVDHCSQQPDFHNKLSFKIAF